MIKAIIFDLDGTLLNTIDDLKESTNYALRKLGYPQRTLGEIKSFVGNGVRKLIECAVPENCSDEITEKCLEIFKEHYSKNMYNQTKSFDGIIELLTQLKNKNIKTGVVSNKFDSAVRELCRKYFNELIDKEIGQSDNIPPKPNPKGVIEILKLFNIPQNETLYVGDSDIDIKTAKNANLKCVAVTWGYQEKNKLENADYIANTPIEILKFLNK